MGWDALSNAKTALRMNYRTKESKRAIANPVIRRTFEAAATFVEQEFETVDAGLELAWLDCLECGRHLQMALGDRVDIYDPRILQPDEVEALASVAEWDFPYPPESAWAHWSARLFLEGCAKHRLTIMFRR